MWFELPDAPPDWVPAARQLSRADPKLARIIRGVGPCTLAPRRDYFVALCKAIFNQQISTAVATVLFGRFRNEFHNRRPTPAGFLASHRRDPEILRRCGLSRQKAAYLIDLSEHFVTSRIPTRKLSRMTDEQVIESLVAVKGIGRWSAEMFLMFVLNRPDVLPVDDLGLREGVREIYDLPARPTAKQLTEIAEPWQPYRSVATWYVWRRAPTWQPSAARIGKKK
ncbi:MAG: DNA-3-methyladenine glycosylase [Phycisphaerales bacterium]|nr:DNA-3-methyladenine glycosylase [Phycisphaerales bacterium]